MELIERGNFSPAEKRRQYRLLVEKVANAAALKQDFQRELNDIEKSLVRKETRRKNEKFSLLINRRLKEDISSTIIWA